MGRGTRFLALWASVSLENSPSSAETILNTTWGWSGDTGWTKFQWKTTLSLELAEIFIVNFVWMAIIAEVLLLLYYTAPKKKSRQGHLWSRKTFIATFHAAFLSLWHWWQPFHKYHSCFTERTKHEYLSWHECTKERNKRYLIQVWVTYC